MQAQLERNATIRHHSTNAKEPSLLAGLIHDGEGRPMTPSHATKSGRRYRYYITRQTEESASGTEAVWRLPAPALEEIAVKGIHLFLKDRLRLSEALDLTKLPPDYIKAILSKATRLGDRIRDAGPGEQRQRHCQTKNLAIFQSPSGCSKSQVFCAVHRKPVITNST